MDWVLLWISKLRQYAGAAYNSIRKTLSFSSKSNVYADLQSRLITHEGMQHCVYKDSLGFYTIGVGRCVDERKTDGLSLDEALLLLRNDITRCANALAPFSWFVTLDKVRQDACVEMVFNLGLDGFLEFKRCITALTLKRFDDAAKELTNSKWATQVAKSRVNDIVYRIQYGKYLVSS